VRRTSRLVLLLGVFLAAMVFVVVLFLNPGSGGQQAANAPSAPPTQLPTLVAAQDIPLGTVVTAEMFTLKTLPITVRDKNVFGDPSQAAGKTTRTAIALGAQVHSTDFQNRAVPLTVPAGKRAMTISVNELTAVGNLVDVGDSVDLIISLRGDAFPVVQVLNDGSITVVSGINPLSVKLPLLLEDVQIIGVIDAPPTAPTTAANGEPLPSQAPAITNLPKLLILAVTPAQAEVMLFARTTGTLDVVLRSPLDAGITVETSGVILKTLVDQYGILPPEIVQVPIPTPLKK
jgi:Flp pilus assembly protein CpaB